MCTEGGVIILAEAARKGLEEVTPAAQKVPLVVVAREGDSRVSS